MLRVGSQRAGTAVSLATSLVPGTIFSPRHSPNRHSVPAHQEPVEEPWAAWTQDRGQCRDTPGVSLRLGSKSRHSGEASAGPLTARLCVAEWSGRQLGCSRKAAPFPLGPLRSPTTQNSLQKTCGGKKAHPQPRVEGKQRQTKPARKCHFLEKICCSESNRKKRPEQQRPLIPA